MKRLALLAGSIGAVGLFVGIYLWQPSPSKAPATEDIISAGTAQFVTTERVTREPGSSPGPARPAILKPVSTNPPAPVFEQFSAWAASFLSHTGNVSVVRGEVLAWQRQQALLELIRVDPERALALAAPFAWRRDLPASIVRHLEQQVDGRGAFRVAVATDFEHGKTTVLREAEIGTHTYEAFVYGRRLAQRCQEDIPMHGIAISNKLALSASPLRVLGREEAEPRSRQKLLSASGVCEVCGRAAAFMADAGGSTVLFCGADHAGLVSQTWILAESGSPRAFSPGDQLGSAPWGLGAKGLLYMRVNFPDDLTEPISEPAAYSVMDNVNSFYVEGSYNQTTLTPTVTPLLTLPQTKGWYSTAGPGALLSDARATAREAGYETANYALDIVALTSVPGYDWGGLGFVGGKGTWLQSAGAGVTAHELGHNYGLMHANFWETTNYSGIAYGTNIEYGNMYDTMGSASAGANHFGADFKNMLGWLPEAAVQAVASNGLCRLYAFDTPHRVEGCTYAARVRKDFERDYWVEFRGRFASNPWMRHGVLLNWSAWSQSSAGDDLLDTTPESPDGKTDAAVVIGRTFSDYPAGVHITPVAEGVSGTNRWLEVQIHSGLFPSNRPPKLKLFVSPTNAAPGELVHFQVEARDPDGDALAYAWFGTSYDTDDRALFSTNNLPWTYRVWSTAGRRVIRCVVSDMKGGIASANALVTVGNPTGFTLSGRVSDVAGKALEGVLVSAGPDPQNSLIGYTDSHGEYMIAGIQGEVELQAIKYGYGFTNQTWTNPVTLLADTAGLDFTAIRRPSVRIESDSYNVAETNTAAHYISLIHTADTNQDVDVTVNLSGSATLGSDYTLNPALSPGTNVVTIPAGTNVAVIEFRAINDSAAESVETMSLTIVDEGKLVVATPGEATLSLIDDDVPARPRVSIVSLVPRVQEDGMDSATFVVSRLGSLGADLPVYYSTSGTATPGQDYPVPLGVLVLRAGEAQATLKIAPINDTQIEPDETLTVALSPDPGYTLGTSSAVATIVSDDVMRVTAYPTGAAAEPSTAGSFLFRRDGDLSGNLELGYTVSGSATPGVDYETLSGKVVIPAGETSAQVWVHPIDDNELEGDESIILTVTNTAALDSATPAMATIWLRDNERTTVSISAPDPEASETGDDIGQFRISRGSVVNGALTVPLTISGLAVNGVDYVTVDNQVVIPDGVSSLTVDLIPLDDLAQEPTEDVQLALLPSPNYNLGNALATVYIKDDDASSPPGIGFTAATSRFRESISPGISVSLSATSASPIMVQYRVIGGTASSNDYRLPDGTLTFDPGDRAKSVPLQVVNDSVPEPDETVKVVLFNPIGASFDGFKLHTYTIVDDDTCAVSVSATVSTASETGPIPGNFRITRSGSNADDLAVRFQLTGTAAAGADYLPLGDSAVIPAGADFVDLPVVPVTDLTEEFSETVKLTLISAPRSKIVSPATATITIQDNDADTRPVVAVDSLASPFALEGGTHGLFTVTRSGPTLTNLTVYLTRSGTATEGADYSPLPSSVTLLAGQSSVTVAVNAVDDSLVEGEETVLLEVTENESYRAAYPSSAMVVLQDNDQSVRVDPSDLVASEPGSDIGEFTFTRFGTTNTPLQVFFTVGGTATPDLDYTNLASSVVIPAGSLTAKVPVVALDDTLVEGPETVTLQLQPDLAYSLETSVSATVTISDDEPMFTITAPTNTVVEGSPDPAVLRVTRTGDPQYEVTAHLAIGGTAAYAVDYSPFATNILFSYGVMEVDLPILVTNDLATEGLETLTAALVPDPSYTILSPSNAIISIVDAGTNLCPTVLITSPTVGTVFLLGSNVNMILEATAVNADTNLPLNLLWSKVEGPDTLQFGPVTNANTTVSFTNFGVYVLRLTADNGTLTNYAEVTAIVGAVELLSVSSLHWALDEGVGTNAFDISGAARTGVISGPFNWSSNGVLGGALELAGSGSEVRETPASGRLNGMEAFTLALWARSPETNLDQGLFTAVDAGTNATLELGRRHNSAHGAGSDVFEAVIATDEAQVRYVSNTNVGVDAWQHLALCWSNGLPPGLYINGVPDRPLARVSALEGVLYNSPQFVVGRGSPEWLQGWQGFVDDVRLFPRALSSKEIYALASLPPANYGAVVEAGSNFTVQVIALAPLSGYVSDDGKPVPPAAVSNTWLVAQSPAGANVTFTNANALTNYVGFDTVGDYVFRLIADDGQVKTFDEVTVTVIEPTRIDIFAMDPEAAELGPDTGAFTLTRTGDETVDLPVYLAMGGFASNGVDFVTITNVYVFPAGSNSLEIVILPYLDDRTEGDEPFTLTVVSNAAYFIGNPQGSVTIHDSPYGAWTVAHFTLEELTDPSLSGAGVDFDHDSLVNFAEYAANRDPRGPETNSPVVMGFETNPPDTNSYVIIQYPRRLEPTDTTYEVHVSNDLLTWQTGTNCVQEIQVTDDGNGLTETVKARLVEPVSSGTNQFVTVKVWLRVTKPE